MRHRVDAVVSSDDTLLSMGGGMSAAILDLAGPVIRDEAAKLVPLKVGQVVVTSAGNIPCRFVLHAITVDWKAGVRPTERTIWQLAGEIFMRCEALGLRRVIVPVLGAGAGRFPPEAAVELMAKALAVHARSRTVLEQVVLTMHGVPNLEQVVGQLKWLLSEERLRVIYEPAERVLGSWSGQFMGPVGEGSTTRTMSPSNRPAPEAPRNAPRRGLSRVLGRFWPKTSPLRGDSSPEADPMAHGPLLTEAATSPGPRAALLHKARPVVNDRYVLLQEVGRGGFGVVCLAWDLVLGQTMAIKLLDQESSDMDVFAREAAIGIVLSHDAIVRVYHYEPRAANDGPYIVMEFVPWNTGEKWIADGGEALLPVDFVLHVGERICDALIYAHRRRVLHLDIKPSNIFVDASGSAAKLGDFGLARSLLGVKDRMLRLEYCGTPDYMAPEQRTHGHAVSPATDIFQLAATLWDFLTGSPPGRRPPQLDRYEPERRGILRSLESALGPDSSTRPQTAEEFRKLLQRAA